MKHIEWISGVFLILFFTSGCQPESVKPVPSLSISLDMNECIKGKTYGIDPKMYNVVAYGKINDGWHSLPNSQLPIISISAESEWVCMVGDAMWDGMNELKVFLIPNTVDPPVLMGEGIIPFSLTLASASRRQVKLMN